MARSEPLFSSTVHDNFGRIFRYSHANAGHGAGEYWSAPPRRPSLGPGIGFGDEAPKAVGGLERGVDDAKPRDAATGGG
jgi:hypothetical protein